MAEKTDLKLDFGSNSIPAVFEQISKIERMLKQFERLVLKETELTPPQYAVINALQTNKELSLTELSEITFSTKSTMTALIDNLEKKNLVERIPNPNDRRSLLVKLTMKGKSLSKSMPHINSMYGECCTALNPVEIAQLRFLLNKLEANLNFEVFEQ